MSVVTADDNTVRDIWEVSPSCTVIRNLGQGDPFILGISY